MLLGIRQAQMRLLAIWLFVMVLPTVLSVEAPHTPVSYTHLRAHETVLDLVCRLLLEKKK